MSVQQLHCPLFCSFLRVERALQVMCLCQWCPSMHGAGWRGLSLMAALQGALGHEGQGLTPSSMKRDSNSYLFPACADQRGTRPVVNIGTVPLPHLCLDGHGCCGHVSVQSWPCLLASHLAHSQCFSVVPTSTPSPSFGYQELLSGGHVRLQSWSSKRDQSCALIFWGLLLGTADTLQYMSVASSSHTGLQMAKLARSVVSFVLPLCLPK